MFEFLQSRGSMLGRAVDLVRLRLNEVCTGNARWIRILFLIFVYATIAGASFDGFYQKWGMRDGGKRFSFVEMIDGTAHRPFVHRQLLPKAANLLDRALPLAAKEAIIERVQQRPWWEERSFLAQLRIDPVAERAYVVRYLFVYFASVGSLFVALFVMRRLCFAVGVGEVAATVAPGLFGLSLVYFQSMGGFFYDYPEVLFLSTAFLLALKGRWLWLVPVTVVATYNKEAFLFFTLALFPLLRSHYPVLKAAGISAMLAGIGSITYLIDRSQFVHNPGASAESWLINSIKFYLHPRNLVAFETNYGIITPRGYSFIGLLLLTLVVARGWRGLSSPVRQHGMLIAAINFPLVLIFCGPGEMRNFSLCYVFLLLLIAQNLSNWVSRAGKATS